MAKVLIAYNNHYETVLHDFFESCADEAKQICVDNNIDFSSVYPPNMNENNVIGAMPFHHLCVIAAHGDIDGIYNEEDEDIVTIHTTNYNFSEKGFYSIACSCAQKLYPHLKDLGLLFFVGYNDALKVRGEQEPFVTCAMAGLRNFLSGDTLKVAKEKMLDEFDRQIAVLDQTDPMAAIKLHHDKEALVFEGENNVSLTDLI